MTLIVLPGGAEPNVTGATFELRRADEALERFDGSAQITTFPKAIWALTFNIPPSNGLTQRRWRAVLASLSSLGNTFQMAPVEAVGRKPSTGYVGANPLIAGASQLGLTLDCDGATNNALVANIGDYLHVVTTSGPELKILTAPALADGSGLVTFTFEPAMRQSPANNAEVFVTDMFGEFRLERARAGWQIDAQITGRMAVTAVEAAV